MKVATAPVILAMQFVMFRKCDLQNKKQFCLASDPARRRPRNSFRRSNDNTGNIFGILGVGSTSLYQIWVKTEQQRLECSSQQLLHHQAKVSAAILFVAAPFLEDVLPGGLGHIKELLVGAGNPADNLRMQNSSDALLSWTWVNSRSVTLLVLSSSLAFMVNLSIFLVIGKTSPLSYNVLGHAKLCCIIVSSVFYFHEVLTLSSGCGVALAVCGIVIYTHLRMQTGISKQQK